MGPAGILLKSGTRQDGPMAQAASLRRVRLWECCLRVGFGGCLKIEERRYSIDCFGPTSCQRKQIHTAGQDVRGT